LEVVAIEGAANQAFIDVLSGPSLIHSSFVIVGFSSQKGKAEEGKPQPPGKTPVGLAKVLKPKYIYGSFYPAGHPVKSAAQVLWWQGETTYDSCQ
jgi:hypothetical protein